MSGARTFTVDEKIGSGIPVSLDEFLEWAWVAGDHEHEMIIVIRSDLHDHGVFPVALCGDDTYALDSEPSGSTEMYCTCGEGSPEGFNIERHLQDVRDA